jgi:hypothetical protein
MQLQIRGLKGKEGKLLSDQQAVRTGAALDNILSACTEELLDPGPYDFEVGGKVTWSKVLVGDRFFILLQIRLASFGPEYEFKTQCREANCRTRFSFEVDLEKDLKVKRLTEEEQDTLRSEGTFSTKLADGREVHYRLATGADEKAAARHKAADRALVDMLASRITSIEGIDGPTEQDIVKGSIVKTVRTFLDDLEWSDLVTLMNALDEHDCGVDPQIEVECPTCGGLQEQTLPFDRGFLLPATPKVPARAGS